MMGSIPLRRLPFLGFVFAGPLLLAACASSGSERPMTWDEREAQAPEDEAGAENEDEGGEVLRAEKKTQAYFDRVAKSEFSYQSCGHRARELKNRSKDEALMMLYGCMKRPDFRDLNLLREKPFHRAFQKDKEARALVLHVLAHRNETLDDELKALRLPIAPAREFIDNPEAHERFQFLVKGRVIKEWQQSGKRMVAIMERAATTAGYTRYTYSYKRNKFSGRYQQQKRKEFVQKKTTSYSGGRYRRGTNNEVVDTGLIVVFTVGKKTRLRTGQTYFLLGSRTSVRIKGTQSLALEDAAALNSTGAGILDDEDEVEYDNEENEAEDFEQAAEIKVTPDTPLLKLDAIVKA